MKQCMNLVNCIILLTGIAVAETLPATDSVDASKTSVYCPLTKDLLKIVSVVNGLRPVAGTAKLILLQKK